MAASSAPSATPAPAALPLVIVADDDADMVLMIQEFLKLSGYASQVADNAAALAPLLACQPVALMLDLIMPDGASEQIMDRLLANQSTLPVILISALPPAALDAHREQLAKRGLVIAAVLRKPFWMDELQRTLALAVAR